jgi:hypothetical protein
VLAVTLSLHRWFFISEFESNICFLYFCYFTKEKMTHFYVLGASTDEDSYFCEHLTKRIAKIDKNVTIEFELLLEVDYLRKLKELTVKFGGDLYTHDLNHLVLKNGEYVGGAMAMINLAKNRYGIEDAEIANTIVFGRMKKDDVFVSKLVVLIGLTLAGTTTFAPWHARIS